MLTNTALADVAALFAAHCDRLLCCNAATGARAAFVQAEGFDRFCEVPHRLEDIHASPFACVPRKIDHSHGLRTITRMLA